MLSPIPESKSKRSAELAEQIRRSRVKITKVPGYEPVPRPARFHPEPKPKLIIQTRSMIKKQDGMHQLKQMAERGYTLRYAAMCLEMPWKRALFLSKELLDQGVVFAQPPERKAD